MYQCIWALELNDVENYTAFYESLDEFFNWWFGQLLISSTFGNEVFSLMHWHLLWAHNRFFFSIVYRRYISSCSVDKPDQCCTESKRDQWFLKQLDPRADWVNFLRVVGQKVLASYCTTFIAVHTLQFTKGHEVCLFAEKLLSLSSMRAPHFVCKMIPAFAIHVCCM